MNKKIIQVLVGIVIIGTSSFYAGIKYGQGGPTGKMSIAQQARFAGGTGTMAGASRGARAGGGFANGDIISKNDTSITIQTRGPSGTGNGSQIIFYSASTSVLKSAEGTADDLTVGKQVTVTGTPNLDGSVTAQSIQIRPAGQSR